MNKDAILATAILALAAEIERLRWDFDGSDYEVFTPDLEKILREIELGNEEISNHDTSV